MNHETFMELDLEQQVLYVNKLLKNISLGRASSMIGVHKNSLKSEFNLYGYIYDYLENQFIKNINTDSDNSYIRDNYSNAISKNNFTTTMKRNSTTKVGHDNLDNYKTTNLENKISDLENEVSKIKEILNNNLHQDYNLSKVTNLDENNKYISNNDIKTYNSSNLVPRTYKVDSSVQQQFKEFCKQNNNYRVSDLVTNALLECMNKFK